MNAKASFSLAKTVIVINKICKGIFMGDGMYNKKEDRPKELQNPFLTQVPAKLFESDFFCKQIKTDFVFSEIGIDFQN